MADAKALVIWNQADPTSQRQAVATLAKGLGRPFVDMSSQSPLTVPPPGAIAWLSESVSDIGDRARAQSLVDDMTRLRHVEFLVFSFTMDERTTKQHLQVADAIITVARRAVAFPRRRYYATLSSTAPDDPRILDAIRSLPQVVANYMDVYQPMPHLAAAFRKVFPEYTRKFDPQSKYADYKRIAYSSEHLLNHRSHENAIVMLKLAPSLALDVLALIFNKDVRNRALAHTAKPPNIVDFLIDQMQPANVLISPPLRQARRSPSP